MSHDKKADMQSDVCNMVVTPSINSDACVERDDSSSSMSELSALKGKTEHYCYGPYDKMSESPNVKNVLIIGDERARKLKFMFPFHDQFTVSVIVLPDADVTIDMLCKFLDNHLQDKTYCAVVLFAFHEELVELYSYSCGNKSFMRMRNRNVNFLKICQVANAYHNMWSMMYQDTHFIWTLPYPVDINSYNIAQAREAGAVYGTQAEMKEDCNEYMTQLNNLNMLDQYLKAFKELTVFNMGILFASTVKDWPSDTIVPHGMLQNGMYPTEVFVERFENRLKDFLKMDACIPSDMSAIQIVQPSGGKSEAKLRGSKRKYKSDGPEPLQNRPYFRTALPEKRSQSRRKGSPRKLSSLKSSIKNTSSEKNTINSNEMPRYPDIIVCDKDVGMDSEEPVEMPCETVLTESPDNLMQETLSDVSTAHVDGSPPVQAQVDKSPVQKDDTLSNNGFDSDTTVHLRTDKNVLGADIDFTPVLKSQKGMIKKGLLRVSLVGDERCSAVPATFTKFECKVITNCAYKKNADIHENCKLASTILGIENSPCDMILLYCFWDDFIRREKLTLTKKKVTFKRLSQTWKTDLKDILWNVTQFHVKLRKSFKKVKIVWTIPKYLNFLHINIAECMKHNVKYGADKSQRDEENEMSFTHFELLEIIHKFLLSLKIPCISFNAILFKKNWHGFYRLKNREEVTISQNPKFNEMLQECIINLSSFEDKSSLTTLHSFSNYKQFESYYDSFLSKQENREHHQIQNSSNQQVSGPSMTKPDLLRQVRKPGLASLAPVSGSKSKNKADDLSLYEPDIKDEPIDESEEDEFRHDSYNDCDVSNSKFGKSMSKDKKAVSAYNSEHCASDNSDEADDTVYISDKYEVKSELASNILNDNDSSKECYDHQAVDLSMSKSSDFENSNPSSLNNSESIYKDLRGSHKNVPLVQIYVDPAAFDAENGAEYNAESSKDIDEVEEKDPLADLPISSAEQVKMKVC